MKTFDDYLDLRAKELKDGLTNFMLVRSAIAPRNPEEVFAPCPEGDRYYTDMDAVGRKMQTYLTECYDQFCCSIDPILDGQPDSILSKIKKSKMSICRTIEHKLTFCSNCREALDLALAALDEQVRIAKEIYKEKNPEAKPVASEDEKE